MFGANLLADLRYGVERLLSLLASAKRAIENSKLVMAASQTLLLIGVVGVLFCKLRSDFNCPAVGLHGLRLLLRLLQHHADTVK